MTQTNELQSDESKSDVPNDSEVLTNPLKGDPQNPCAGLRRCAYAATNRLAVVAPGDLSHVVCSILRNLCRRLNAMDAHLFRVRQDEAGSGFIGIRYHSGSCATDADLAFLRRFQFELLPRRLRECLRDGEIVQLRRDSGKGGRMLFGLMKQLNCECYLLCPVLVDGKLRGVLGIAAGSTEEFSDEAEFLELLQLNAAILLNHVLRVRRERVRKRKLRKWRKIADQACDFALTIDSRGIIVDTTAFGAGKGTPDLLGLRLEDIVSRTFHSQIRKQIDRAIITMTVRTCDFQLTLGADGTRWYLARIEPPGIGGRDSVTLYLTDNSPDRELIEQNRELMEQLDRASRLSLLGQMSTEFAHQLNQPLQVILNHCNTMQRRLQKGTATSEKSMAALDSIETSVLHSAEIIARIRDFVRFRSMQTEETDLELIIDQAVMMVMPTVCGRNAELVVPSGISGISVTIDRAQTVHVLVNLMINALEACCEYNVMRPRIELSVLPDGQHGRLVVCVRDNGPGLPKKDPDIVFRKFYTGKEEGLGMGLTISRDVCESQGGSLTATNNIDGEGCTFAVVLPLAGFSGADTAELEVIADVKPVID